MATTSRDVKMVLSVESLGQENITKLEKSLRDLAATGDASAAEFSALADQIARLGGQNDALQAVKALAADTDALSTKQAQAAQTAQELATKLDGLKAATNETKTAQEAARAALTAGQTAYVEAGNALRLLKTEYDAAGRKTAEYRAEQTRLVGAQNEASAALAGLREANRQATAAVAEAGAEQRKAETAYRAANTQYVAADKALADHNRALREAGKAAEALSVEVADLGAAETGLIATLTRATSAAQARKAAVADMAEADRLAAIEAAGMQALYAKGAAALQAETLALRDAAKAVQDYETAKAKAAADAAAWQREAEAIVNMKLAQQQATATTTEMLTKLQQLRDTQAFERQAAEAKKMTQAAEYVRFWEQALDSADRKQAELAAGTKRVNDAFKQINVRPIEVVKQEIADTSAAMATLATSGKLTGGALAVAMAQAQTKVEGLQLEMRQLTGTMTAADKVSNLLKNSMGQIAAGNVIADGTGYLVNKVKELGAAFVSTIADTEKLRRGLNAVYKDSDLTARQMEFLRSTAVSSGVAVGDLGPAFLRFAAATKAANLPLQVTNDLFAAVTRASGTLGLSGEQVSGMLEALSQMASKGTVSMEELRQQLGDRLPGALSLVAQGLSITEAELIKLVESGQLTARDMFPALTQALKTMHGEVTGLTPTWENFKNVLTGVAQDAGDAGWAQILTGALKVLGGTLGMVALGLSTIWEAMRLVGVGVVALAATLRGEGAEAWGHFNEQVSVSLDRLAKQNDRLSAMLDPASEAAARVRELGKTNADAGNSAQRTAAQINAQTEAFSGTRESAALLAETTKVLDNTQMGLGARIVKINSLTIKRLDTLEQEAVAAGKTAKAVETQGDALVALSKLRGTETAALQAQLSATEAHLAAKQKEAEAQRSVTAVLVNQRNAMIKLAEQGGMNQEQLTDTLKTIDKKLVQAKAELAQANATVAKLKEEAAARRLAAQTYGDQSARLGEYQKEVERLKTTLVEYQRLNLQGKKLDEEVLAVQQALAEAEYRRNDAHNDLLAKMRLETQEKTVGLQATLASRNAEVSLYEAKAQSARASGDLATATTYEEQAKRAKIAADKISLQIKEIELQLEREELALKLEKLKIDEPENTNKIKELELRQKLADVKGQELAAAKELLRMKESEVSLGGQLTGTIRGEHAARTGAVGAVVSHSDAMAKLLTQYQLSADYSAQQITLLEREAAAAEKAAEAYRKKWNVDKDGFTLDANGQRMQQAVATDRYVYDTAKSQGLSERDALQLVDQFMRDGKPTGMPGRGLGPSKDWFSVVNEAISARVMENARQGVNGTPQATPTAPTAQPTPAASPGKAVTINLGGRTSRINTSSDADANALVALLRQLENDMGRAA